jgi:hypothetical protein
MRNAINETMNSTANELRMTTNAAGAATTSFMSEYSLSLVSPTNQTGYYTDGLTSVLNSGGKVEVKSLGEVNVVSKRVLCDITDFNMVLENTNATAGANIGVSSLQTYKSGRNVAQNDIAYQSAYAKNYLGNKTEYTRITSQTTNSIVGGGDDEAIGIWCAVNGTTQQVFLFNGADNENNSFRPLDLNINALKSSSGNVSIDASGSSGTGNTNISAKYC